MKFKFKYSKIILLILFTLQLSVYVKAQLVARNIENIDTKTTNSNSGIYIFIDFLLDWNLGEMLSHSMTDSSSFFYTPGFLQSKDVHVIYILPTSVISNLPWNEASIRVYPNPVESNLHIFNSQWGNTIQSIEIIDIGGKCIKKIDQPLGLNNFQQNLNMTEFPPGTYGLLIRYIDQNNVSKIIHYKIVKI